MRLAILISGRGSNMRAICDACRRGEIDAAAIEVIADRADAAGLGVAQQLGHATRLVDASTFPTRLAFEQALQAALDQFAADAIALAGFMRILGEEFVAAYAGRMLNIHPSLLPKYKGLHTHGRVLAAGEPLHGATVHYVTAELDGGPRVLQGRVRVLPGDDEHSLSARVQACEHIIYPRVLGWLSRGRLHLRGGTAELDRVPLTEPLQEDFGEIN